MGDNGHRDREQLRADAEAALAEPQAPPFMVPQTATINLGFQQHEGRNVAIVAHVMVPGAAIMVGLDADYARAIGAALIEHAAGVDTGPRLAVATPEETEHVTKRGPRR